MRMTIIEWWNKGEVKLSKKPAFPKECEGCARSNGKWCGTFKNPFEMWEKGKCWGYTTDPNWFVALVEASKRYTQQIYGSAFKETRTRALIKEHASWLAGGVCQVSCRISF